MLAAVGLLVGGVLLHMVLPTWPGGWLAMAAVLFLLAWVGRRFVWPGRLVLAGAVVALGVGLAQGERLAYAADDLGLVAGEQVRLARVRLRVDRPPGLVGPGAASAGTLPLPPKLAFVGEAVEVLGAGGWRAARGRVLVQVMTPTAGVEAGQVREVLGMLQRPGVAVNPGQFDWAAAYRGDRVLASLRADDAGQVLAEATTGPVAAGRRAVRGWLEAGFAGQDRRERALLAALLLGEHDPHMSEVRDDFRTLGASHHLAVSGMHVAVLGGLLLGVLRLLDTPPRASAAAVAVFVLLFATLAVPSPGVWRAAALVIVAALGVNLRRRVDAVQLLAVAAAALIVARPMEVYEPGFQLSFGTVLGLIVFAPPLKRRLVEAARPTGATADDRLARAARWADGKLVGGVAAAVVAWLVSLPLIALHFETLNPWAVAAGLLLTVPTVLALVAGLGKVLLTAVLPGLAEVWAWPATLAARLMAGSAEVLTVLPGAEVPLPAPPGWLVVAYYVALLLMLVRWPTAGVRWSMRAALPICLVLILALPFARPLPLLAAGGSAGGACRVTVLSVGAGQCVLIEPPGGRAVVIDVGGSLRDVMRSAVAPALRARRVTSVDTLILTHANLDHYGAAAELTRRYGVREVLAGPAFAREAAREGTGRLLLRELDGLDRPPRVARAGDTLRLAADTTLTVLHPAGAVGGNDGSLVLRLDHAGRRVLLPADVQDAGMTALLDAGTDLRCDVLLAPHHGSAERSTAAFIAAADPLYVVSSNDRTLSQKQRRFAGQVQGRPLLRTNEVGAVTIHLGGDGTLEVETFLQRDE